MNYNQEYQCLKCKKNLKRHIGCSFSKYNDWRRFDFLCWQCHKCWIIYFDKNRVKKTLKDYCKDSKHSKKIIQKIYKETLNNYDKMIDFFVLRGWKKVAIKKPH